MTTVTFSLISHTNVGKTTLARTLLRREIGEVRDQPHVTTIAEAHSLIETDDARLLLCTRSGTACATGRSGAARKRCGTCETRPTSFCIS
jgi:hypothetical protein